MGKLARDMERAMRAVAANCGNSEAKALMQNESLIDTIQKIPKEQTR